MAERSAVRTEQKLKPKLFSVMKTYTRAQLVKDITAGIIVAIIALPLSIALALASGVSPEQGLYTAIVAGFFVAFFGGSRVQIAGPTAAFATIVAGIVATQGMDGLIISTILAGIIMIVMGFCRLGALIKYIPGTITTGFTFGIALTILIGQIKDFLGLTFQNAPIETIDKVTEIFRCIGTVNWQAVLVGVISLAVLILWRGKLEIIPASLIAVIVGSVIVKVFHMDVNTIDSLYTISNAPPHLTIPSGITIQRIRDLLPNAFTIAVLASVESLLSCVVADGMIGSKHRSNMELIAQGMANIASALFGGIPATGAIARTAANVKNGGRTPIAGIVHSIVVLLILVLLMKWAGLIPMPTIAAILFVVAYNMSGWRNIRNTIRTAPKSDIAVLFVTLFLTVVFDLVVAIGAGLVMAAMLFMKRMADVTEAHTWVEFDEDNEDTDPDSIHLKKIPDRTRVYEINGPMFFAAADKYKYMLHDWDIDVLLIRMRNVPAMDATGVEALLRIVERCRRHNVRVVFSHVNEQPMRAMEKAGFVEMIGQENFCNHIDTALARAGEIEAGIQAEKTTA